jgi:hypothetical protein
MGTIKEQCMTRLSRKRRCNYGQGRRKLTFLFWAMLPLEEEEEEVEGWCGTSMFQNNVPHCRLRK